jgi:glucose-1-phosphatase
MLIFSCLGFFYKIKGMIAACLFDLGNVLVPFQMDRGYTTFASISGLDPKEIAARLGKSPVYAEYEAGRLSTAEFHREIIALLGYACTLEQLREAWNHVFLEATPGMDELLGTLRKKHRMVLLSNTNELHFEWLREHCPSLRHFDGFALSHEVKAMKPESAIYQYAVGLAGCEASECFYTDDVLRYVEAARELGISAEQFVGMEQLKTHLAQRGMSF